MTLRDRCEDLQDAQADHLKSLVIVTKERNELEVRIHPVWD